jgi:hypothetical protein
MAAIILLIDSRLSFPVSSVLSLVEALVSPCLDVSVLDLKDNVRSQLKICPGLPL